MTALDLFMEIESASGARYNWDANQLPANRLQNVSISTKLGEGFSTLTGNLARRIDVDYPDLRLNQLIVVVGADGHVVFEGRLASMPREVADTHSISVTFVGHMAHAADRPFSEVYVDRDLAGWGPMSLKRRAVELQGGWGKVEAPSTGVDPTDGQAGLVVGFSEPWAAAHKPLCEAWYDAGPECFVGQVTYSWLLLSPAADLNPADANWNWDVILCVDPEAAGTVQTTGNLRAAGPTLNASLVANAGNYRYVLARLFYNSAPAGAAGVTYQILYNKLAVYGTHGLPLHTGESTEPDGVYASDVIKDVAARFCPLLNTAGVGDTNYVIQHLKFQRVQPHDAFLEVNKYHLNHLAVWENRTLHYRPYDLSDYDWEIRTDDPGVTFSPVGLSAEDLFNGIVVVYKDIITGQENVLTPTGDATLADLSDENPWNEWGIQHWDQLDLSTPTTGTQALQIGRAALADKNRPKTPGTMTVTGYIRDREGHYQPASYPRAGDVICITNFNEINRLIVETDWDDESKQMRIAVDLPFQILEALFDRQANALQAKGIS
jgi:hypothetical protein